MKPNLLYLILGILLLAVLIFASWNYDVASWIINLFIVPVIFIIYRGIYNNKVTSSLDITIISGITLGVIISILLSRNSTLSVILNNTIATLVGAGIVILILAMKRKKQ